MIGFLKSALITAADWFGVPRPVTDVVIGLGTKVQEWVTGGSTGSVDSTFIAGSLGTLAGPGYEIGGPIPYTPSWTTEDEYAAYLLKEWEHNVKMYDNFGAMGQGNLHGPKYATYHTPNFELLIDSIFR